MPCTPESRDASSARNDADDSPAVRPRHADVGADGHVEEMVRVYEREPPADAHPTPPLRGGVKAAPAAPPPPPPPPPSSSSIPHPHPSRRQVPRRTTQGGRFNISRTLRNFLPSSSSSSSSASASASAASSTSSTPAVVDPHLHSAELPPPPQRAAPTPSSPATPAAAAAAAATATVSAGGTDTDDSPDSPCEAEVSFGADTPSPRADEPEAHPLPPAGPTHTPPTHGHAESDSEEESDCADDGYPVGSGGLPPPPVRHPPVFSTFSAPPPTSPPTSATAPAPRASPAGVRPTVVTPISHRRSPGGGGVGSPLGSSGSPQAPPEEIVSEAPGSRAAAAAASAAGEATATAAAATTRVTSAEPWGSRPGLARDAVRRTQGPVRTPVTPLSPAPAQQQRQQLEEEDSPEEEEEEAIEAPEAAPEGSQRLCGGCGTAKQQWACVGCSEAVVEAKAEARQEWMARARLDQELMQLKDRHKKLADRVSSGKEEADDLEEDLADANVVISRQHRRIDALTGELEKRQEQQFTAIEELAEAKSVLKQQHARIEELFHESNEEKRKRQSAEGWLFQLREQCLRLKDVVDDRDAYRLRIERLERQYEDERALRKSVQDNYNTLWDRSAALETTEREVRRELERKHSETEAMRRAWYQMNNELSKARESVHSLNKYNAHLQQRMQDEEGGGRETVQSAMTALASQGIDEINDAQASALASSLSEITPHVVASLFREQAEPKQYIKRMMATMHPDKTAIPACKETLQKRFQILNHCRSLLS